MRKRDTGEAHFYPKMVSQIGSAMVSQIGRVMESPISSAMESPIGRVMESRGVHDLRWYNNIYH